MNDPRSLALLEDLQERTALRARCDPPDHDTARWFAQQLAAVRADVLRLETLAERLTGVTKGWTPAP